MEKNLLVEQSPMSVGPKTCEYCKWLIENSFTDTGIHFPIGIQKRKIEEGRRREYFYCFLFFQGNNCRHDICYRQTEYKSEKLTSVDLLINQQKWILVNSENIITGTKIIFCWCSCSHMHQPIYHSPRSRCTLHQFLWTPFNFPTPKKKFARPKLTSAQSLSAQKFKRTR